MSASENGFPDLRWGRGDTKAARTGQWAVSTKPGSWIVRTMVPIDRWI